MKHKGRRRVKRVEKKLRRLAAAVAGAAILTSAMIPGIPAATVHASPANPNVGNNPVSTAQQVEQGAPSQAPASATKAPLTDPKPTGAAQQQVNKDRHHESTESKTKAPKVPAKVTENAVKEVNITATAYAPGPHDNDQWGDKTYSGTQIRPGVIAVDPSLIPLGSRVYIQYPDGHGEYAIAEDTGGAIKGNRIDVAKWTVNEAQDFGIQHVKVFVLDNPDKEA